MCVGILDKLGKGRKWLPSRDIITIFASGKL